MQKQIQTVKALCVEADKLIRLSESIVGCQATKDLKLAKGWLGKLLAELGAATPYTPATTASEIPPTADVSTDVIPFGDQDELMQINYLRDKLKNFLEKEFNPKMYWSAEFNQDSMKLCVVNAYSRFQEASMMLGFMLSDLKDGIPDEASSALWIQGSNSRFDSGNPAFALKTTGVSEMKLPVTDEVPAVGIVDPDSLISDDEKKRRGFRN